MKKYFAVILFALITCNPIPHTDARSYSSGSSRSFSSSRSYSSGSRSYSSGSRSYTPSRSFFSGNSSVSGGVPKSSNIDSSASRALQQQQSTTAYRKANPAPTTSTPSSTRSYVESTPSSTRSYVGTVHDSGYAPTPIIVVHSTPWYYGGSYYDAHPTAMMWSFVILLVVLVMLIICFIVF